MEYPIDHDESPQPAISEPREKKTNLLFSGLKILVTGIAIPVLVSIGTSYYVNTHLLKPRLRADYSWAEVMVMSVTDRPNEFVAALIDFYPGFQTTLPPSKNSLEEVGKPLAFTGGQIATAKHLRFKSANDYTIDSSSTSSRILKIMIVNNGSTTAHHIDIGLHFLQDSTDYKIIPSPNIRISDSAVVAVGSIPRL